MHALDINIPNYANAILSTEELVAKLTLNPVQQEETCV
jgi:hypothetical protein